MNIENLKTFLLLAQLKNFTQTADQCFVAQSTVTNRIMELEKEVGRQLFIRNKKQVSLTEEGRYFLPYAKSIVELEDSALAGLKSYPSFSASLRIGTVNTVYDCHLAPVISSFLKRRPDISVKVVVDHSNILYRHLQDGTMDIIFTVIPARKNGCVTKVFRTDELVLVTAKENREYLSGVRKNQLSDLYYLYCDFVIQDGAKFIRDIFPKNYPFPFEIDKSTKLLSYLLDGIGCSFLPRSFVQEYLNSGELLEIPLIGFSAPEITSYVVMKENKKEEEAVSAFLQLLPKDPDIKKAP